MLRRGVLAAVAAITLAAGPQATAAGSETDALARASARGRAIYDYDGAGWVSTDKLLATVKDPTKAGVRGYVVEPAERGALKATYYALDGAAPRALFVAEVRGRKVVSSRLVKAGEDATLSPLALRLISAREVAAKEAVAKRYGPCVRQPFNAVALPPETPDGPVVVYLLTPQVNPQEFPAGGHYEVDVDAAGHVVGSRAFTKSCMALPGGGQTAGLMMTHLLDPTPTEIHVFLSLSSRLPVFVATSDGRLWKVAGDKIEPMKR